MIEINSGVMAAYCMSCRESSAADVKTIFLVVTCFQWENSSSTNMKALWGHFGPTLSKKSDCVKKAENPRFS